MADPSEDGKESGMADDQLSLNKLSQLSPSGKMKDPKQIPVGKELPRKKKGKKNPPGSSPEAGNGPREEKKEKGTAPPSGQVVDIII
jgi:hypothetical protein